MSEAKSSALPTWSDSASSTSLAVISSYIDAGANRRVPDVQAWPWCRYVAHSEPGIAMSRSASSSRMFGPLPPSSSEMCLRFPDASCMIRRPTSVEPVNVTLSTRSSVTSASPAVGPWPGTTLTTPGGMSDSARIPAKARADSGVSSAGFSTIVFPVAIAGGIFHMAIM
jgi:hypothetical protein